MDLVTGALAVLPSKLLDLLKEEYKLQKNVRVKVQSLSRELECMHAALRKVAAVPWDQLDEQVKIWAREVREASYEIEDILDTFLVRVDGLEHPHLSRLKRAMKKMGDPFNKGKARHEISCAINDITKQIQEMTERHARYKVDDLVAKPAAPTSIDPRLSALYSKVSQLVGIGGARDKVPKMLTSVGEDMETKIVSIVGFGGLGKTTLAKVVYENLTDEVSFKAFVPVGQNPDLKKVLKDILIGLDKCHYTKEFNMTILDERQLTDELREFLKDKRYFVVIDDIWDVPSWNIVRYALYDNSLGSKIVITTRKHDVAIEAGCSYNMEPLPYQSSRELFYGRIFVSQQKCPTNFVRISEEIIKKCGGVPLAIITTSSLLANKLGNMKEWYDFYESIGSGLGTNPEMENMRKIVSLSYYDLPAHLKTCLLYLSIFPEDYQISSERLIWRWIAEGFVASTEGEQSLFELGRSYFCELIKRNLIQLANGDEEGSHWTCHVHDMVLDLICSISREECFISSTLGDDKQNIPSWGSKVRRLSLHNCTWPIIDMSKLRSVTIFSDAIINSMPSLSCHHILRVLDLEGCRLKDHPNLSFVGILYHLRYLGLQNTGYAGELPLEIGKLQFLQTLDLVGTNIKELPSSIVWLRRLMCLGLNWRVCLPNGLRNLTTLEVIRCAIVDSAHIAEELGHLTELRILSVELKLDKEAGCENEGICNGLVESLDKLQKIRHLAVSTIHVVMNLEGSLESLGRLSYLCIYRTSFLPTWINSGSLLLLSSLDITVAQVRKEEIQVLGMLQALRVLKVFVSGDKGPMLGRFMVAPDAFPCVGKCIFCGFVTVPSMFPRGAMSRLEDLSFRISLQDFFQGGFTNDDLALDHLPSLRTVNAYLRCEKENMDQEMEMKLKEKLKQEADGHRNCPSLDFY